MSDWSFIDSQGPVSIALETNWRGYMGHVVEFPGAYVRGPTEDEALAKVGTEVDAYLRWLDRSPQSDFTVQVVQKHRGIRPVEDGDTEILLDADKGEMTADEFGNFLDLARFSGGIFDRVYQTCLNKDWVDEEAVRTTFYGERPATVNGIYDHVKQCHFYYLSRLKISDTVEGEFVAIRDFALNALDRLFQKNSNSLRYELDQEQWTLKKVVRRLIWHDRIHGKAMTRILEKQLRQGIIDGYEDSFRFDLAAHQA